MYKLYRPYEFPRQHRFMRYWINHNATVKKQNSATRTEDSTSVRAQNLLHNLHFNITQAGSVSVGLPGELARPKLVCTNHMGFLVSTNLCGTG